MFKPSTKISQKKQDIRIYLRAIHRDTGYLFLGLLIAYSISGIALNHRATWNPRSYVASSDPISTNFIMQKDSVTEAKVIELLNELELDQTNFRDYYFSRDNESMLRIVLKEQRIELNIETGKGEIETVKSRYGLAEMVFLHQTTKPGWIWFADIFGVAMILISFTGMFLLKGKKGITSRGAVLGIAGLIFPIIAVIWLY